MTTIEKRNYPKVLVVSVVTWKDNGTTHTEPDLFKCWDPEKVAVVYTRSDLPETKSCQNFFQISENLVIKSVISRKSVGISLDPEIKRSEKQEKAEKQEAALYSRSKKKSWFLTIARELVWFLGKWRTPALERYVAEENPDLYFFPIYPVAFMGWLQLWILKKHPKPYVCFLMDDNYSYKPCGRNPLALLHRAMLRRPVAKLAKNCNEMFAITEYQAKEIDYLFRTKSVVLTKGIDFSRLEYKPPIVHTPVKMVYTGKLILGRASALVALSKAMRNINETKTRVTLDIYSPDVLDDETMAMLNKNGCTFRGFVSKEEAELVQKESDIVVFVESLEKRYKYIARLSFSTKLTDYFKSGKCIFAIGDKDIAPIRYLEDNDAAIVCTEYEGIEKAVRRLLDDPSEIVAYGRKAFNCGENNHDINLMNERFINTMKKAFN